MANELQPARGTHDLIGEDQRRHAHVVETARRIAATYGFDEWTTPIFEDTRVFSRTLGETSDVVTKEMYTFNDRGGDSITLRPEATAGMCRALVTNGLTQSLPQKVFYAGPMFRYERPQKGRYRQFHQIDIELIGPSEPLADAEVIACGWDILKALGVADDTVLEINTLGDKDSRAAYRDALVAISPQHQAALSQDSLARLDRNPMRILDSKDEGDRRIVADAPTDRRPPDRGGGGFYAGVRPSWTGLACRSGKTRASCAAWTITATPRSSSSPTKLGAQGTVMGGGRYDGLVQEMGGPPTPAVGWAAGRRAAGACCWTTRPRRRRRSRWCRSARRRRRRRWASCSRCAHAGIRAEMAYRGNLRRRMERANRIGARAAVILGEDDLAQGVAQVKDLATGDAGGGGAAGSSPPGCDEPRRSNSTASPRARRNCARCWARASPAKPMCRPRRNCPRSNRWWHASAICAPPNAPRRKPRRCWPIPRCTSWRKRNCAT